MLLPDLKPQIQLLLEVLCRVYYTGFLSYYNISLIVLSIVCTKILQTGK